MNEVLFNPPPNPFLQNEIHDSVQKYFGLIPPGRVGGIFGVATKDSQGRVLTNAVVAVKKGDRLEIVGYIGKTWGEKINWGGEVKFFF